ncbi:hypothetical protein BGZ75_001122 [Mortierella antarctica]|nr:hypothetical protein BGZ75_001122 [Mortierella antarctica]
MGAHWKREYVQDHKFDFINVDDFVDNSCWRQFTYSLVFAAIIRGILVYCSDIFTAANLLANSNENSFVPKTGVQLELFGKLPFEVYKWLFAGCILLGFLLLGLEIRRARAIVISRDISYAFTSLIASRYYTVRSYPHFCFFAQINNSKKTVDEVAFFCFFTFRNWKRLMLADAPRQVINGTILYQTFREHFNASFFQWDVIIGQGNQFIYKKIALGAMIFTVFMFALSLLMLIIAVILYIPLVSHIQGNLKEYCCHKIDKRIDELIRKKSRTRAADEAGKNGRDGVMTNLQQPTLPQVDMLDESPSTAVGTPRTPYAQKKTPTQYHAQTPGSAYNYAQHPKQQQQQRSDYGYATPPGNGYNSNNNNNNNINSSSNIAHQQQHQPGQQGYDYYQTRSPPALRPTTPGKQKSNIDPYAESAFTSDDHYGNYQPHQGQSQPREMYGGNPYPNGGPGSVGNYYNGASSRNNSTPYVGQMPPAAGRYENSGHQRPASPIQSQHGSELESHHSSSVGVGHGYGPGSAAGSGAAMYSSQPRFGQPVARRQDTAQSRNAYRGGGGGVGY